MLRKLDFLSVVVVGLVVLSTSSDVLARPPGPATFCATYPTSPLCVGGPPPCTLCHEGAPPVRNVYGAAVEQHLLPGAPRPLTDDAYAAALPKALHTVEHVDSDSDKTTNLAEIAAGSFPGNATSTPGALTCPPLGQNPSYSVCHYDPRYVLRKVSLDFCGEPPLLEELERIEKQSEVDQRKTIDDKLTECMATAFWAGKNGQVWQLANSKIRPIGAFKGGPEDGGFLPIADYYHDFRLWAYTQTGDHDCREVLTASYWVEQTSPTTYAALSPSAEQALFSMFDKEDVPADKRAGVLSSRWTLLYTIMFAILPRGAAAQAMRAFLDEEIARMEGLTPISSEPVDYDKKGVTNPTCAACHSTLDPLAYAFRNYNGFGNSAAKAPPGKGPLSRATYVENRMDWFNTAYPGISSMPSGFIFGQPVESLMDWAQRAANSDQFARARVNDYWRLLMGGEPDSPANAAEYAKLWQDLKGPHNYRIAKLLKDLIHTEAYGAP